MQFSSSVSVRTYVFVVLSVGFGKSLSFDAISQREPGQSFVVVVTLLNAIMKDQTEFLVEGSLCLFMYYVSLRG